MFCADILVCAAAAGLLAKPGVPEIAPQAWIAAFAELAYIILSAAF